MEKRCQNIIETARMMQRLKMMEDENSGTILWETEKKTNAERLILWDSVNKWKITCDWKNQGVQWGKEMRDGVAGTEWRRVREKEVQGGTGEEGGKEIEGGLVILRAGWLTLLQPFVRHWRRAGGGDSREVCTFNYNLPIYIQWTHIYSLSHTHALSLYPCCPPYNANIW